MITGAVQIANSYNSAAAQYGADGIQTGIGRQPPMNSATNDFSMDGNDDAPPEPDNISDSVIKNSDWADNITVERLAGETRIVITLTVSYDGVVGETNANKYIASIKADWTKTVTDDNGHKWSSTVNLVPIGEDRLPGVGPQRGDLQIRRCLTCSDTNPGIAHYGRPVIHIFRRPGPYTASHEFGHALGLFHQANASGSIMSYARHREVGVWELRQISRTYGQ